MDITASISHQTSFADDDALAAAAQVLAWYEGTLYDGEHDAIVDAEVWQQVQETLRRNGLAGGRGGTQQVRGAAHGPAMLHTLRVWHGALV
ncbi:MAG: hypothetical protein F4Y86_19440 [Gammaproteobacteria bacterium]|nr:hypothetical protein [Gammaproteobacteria bacterium]MYB37738.1 hypothetical protein [Gammaproteobacteria bacterium]